MSKHREDRRRLMLRAQLRVHGAMRDAQVHDASSRGLSMSAPDAPQRGEIVEVMFGRNVLVGQVRWSRGNRFGVVLQDRIDVAELAKGIVARKGAAAAGKVAAQPQGLSLNDKLFFAACAVAGLAFLVHAYINWM